MEATFIDWLRNRLPPQSGVPIDIGDDAAVLDLPGPTSLVVATDLLADGTHFVLGECGAARAGHKALGVNLSDLAAMAARPVAAFVSLALPRSDSLQTAQELIEGMLPLAARHGCPIAGGDTNVWDGRLVVNVAVVGTAAESGPLTRAGARIGDWILVTGACGGSILGRHLDVVPRVDEALRLSGEYKLHAGIDISDGLARDLSRICTASGCGAVIELDSVPIHPDAERAAREGTDKRTALDHALGDGEDFELILTASPDEAARILSDQPLDVRVTKIGATVSEQGLWTPSRSGPRIPLATSGYEH